MPLTSPIPKAAMPAVCPVCGGEGGKPVLHQWTECCGNAMPNGDCCGNGIDREQWGFNPPCPHCTDPVAARDAVWPTEMGGV